MEVMIFLAISGIIFAAAATLFQGQQGKTQFEQGMRDLASKIQQYVDQVGSSEFNGGGQYNCAISNSTGRAELSAGNANTGTNQGCVFLGRAIQVLPGQPNVYIYSVLGSQYDSNGDTVTSYAGALPEPAFNTGADISEEYDTTWGKVLSSKVTYTSGSTVNSTLVSFYNSLQDGYQKSGAAGGPSITARGYNYNDNSLSSIKSTALKSCLEEQSANGVDCTNTPTINNWSACFASTGSSQTAILSVTSTPAGITTDANFTSCS